MCNHDSTHAVTACHCDVHGPILNVPPHMSSWVEVLETIKTETKQSQNVYIITVPHSDACLTSLYHLTLHHMSYS